MRSTPRNLSEKKKCRAANGTSITWLVGFLIVIYFFYAPSLMMQGTSAPVVIDEDSYGSWEDDFEDTSGIEMWDNLVLNAGDIELINIPIFSDNFTGNDGDPPNSTKWNITDDGQTLEIQNNYLKASGISAPGVWVNEYVLSKNPISMNHILTWRANIHTLSTGSYYHFGIINGSDDSGLIGVSQNYLDNYGILNYYEASSTSIGSSVSGWHDYKVTFNSGIIEFYFDGVKKFEYDFNVTSVRYQFGARIFAEQTCTLYSDDVLITSYANVGNLTSTEIILPNGQTWESLIVNKSEYDTENRIKVTILDGGTYQPIPGFENLTGTNIDISAIDIGTYPTIRLKALFSGDGNFTPVLHGWKVIWADTIPPATPTGLAINNPFTGYSLLLSWNSNIEGDLSGYALYYSTDNNTFNWLINISTGTISFMHNVLASGTTYHYKIAAFDEVPNQSPFSEIVNGTPDLDYDGDGIGNIEDPDDDNDGISDVDDPYPYRDINDMEVTLDNLTIDIDMLRTWLEVVIYNVEANINATNNTLHQQLDDLDSMMTNFYYDLTDDIGNVQTDLLSHDQNTDQNHSIQIDLLNDLLEGQIEKEKIEELRTMLVNLAGNLSEHNQSIAGDILDVVDNIDEFQTETDDRLQGINQTLDQLEQLEDILGDLEALDQSLEQAEDDIQDSLDERSTRDEDEDRFFMIELFLILLFILLIINMILTVLMGKRRGEGGEEKMHKPPSQMNPPKPPSEVPSMTSPPPPPDEMKLEKP